MPTAYEEQFPDYAEYLKMQVVPGQDPATFAHYDCHKNYIDFFLAGSVWDRIQNILDLGCNTGPGLTAWRDYGFTELYGLDLNPDNISQCKSQGFLCTHAVDLNSWHVREMFSPEFFSIIYSTHVLEHMYSPSTVVKHCYDLLKPGGMFFVVLPYPDGDSPGHLGSVELGTCQAPGLRHSAPYDDGQTVKEFFTKHGFSVLNSKYDSRREPEIWLQMQKVGA